MNNVTSKQTDFKNKCIQSTDYYLLKLQEPQTVQNIFPKLKLNDYKVSF